MRLFLNSIQSFNTFRSARKKYEITRFTEFARYHCETVEHLSSKHTIL